MKNYLCITVLLCSSILYSETTSINCEYVPLDKSKTNIRLVFNLNEEKAEIYYSYLSEKKEIVNLMTTAQFETTPNMINFKHPGINQEYEPRGLLYKTPIVGDSIKNILIPKNKQNLNLKKSNERNPHVIFVNRKDLTFSIKIGSKEPKQGACKVSAVNEKENII